MSKSALIITSINENADSFVTYDNQESFDFILVGDKKGPYNNPLSNGIFLGIDEQLKLEFQSAKNLPYHHYSRKNLGYLYAMVAGYTVIYETDDDNLPNEKFPPHLTQSATLTSLANNDGYVNIYSEYTNLNIWPRGFPLSKIRSRSMNKHTTYECDIGVWQGLANLDPDVDAIHRLVFDLREVKFENGRYAIHPGNYCPFNSQNTTWYSDAFPLMYLPCTVPFRMTDILRSFVTQRILWNMDLVVGFHEATVEQARNEHDLMKDFADEQSMYLDTLGIISVLENQDLANKSPTQCLEQCYLALIKAGFVAETEMQYLNCWIHDIEQLKTIL